MILFLVALLPCVCADVTLSGDVSGLISNTSCGSLQGVPLRLSPSTENGTPLWNNGTSWISSVLVNVTITSTANVRNITGNPTVYPGMQIGGAMSTNQVMSTSGIYTDNIYGGQALSNIRLQGQNTNVTFAAPNAGVVWESNSLTRSTAGKLDVSGSFSALNTLRMQSYSLKTQTVLQTPGTYFSLPAGLVATGVAVTQNNTSLTSATGVSVQNIIVNATAQKGAVTTAKGINVIASSNPLNTIGTHIGVNVLPLTNATCTYKYGMRIGSPTGASIANALNFIAATANSGGITFGNETTRTANIYRQTANVLRNDGGLRVASQLDSLREISANGNVDTVVGSISGLAFATTLPRLSGTPLTVPGASINGLLTVAVNSGGSGYAVNNALTVTGCSGSGAIVTVSTVSSGVVTAVTITRPGINYIVGTGCAVTGGAGTGATIDITSVGYTQITNVAAYQSTSVSATTSTAGVTEAIGLQIGSNNLGSGPVTVFVNIGIDILAQTAACVENYGMRVNGSMYFTDMTGVQAGGIEFGADDTVFRPNLYRSRASTVNNLGDFSVRHYYSYTTAPIATLYAGAGTGATVEVSGTDCAMTINITTGIPTTAEATIVGITYSAPFNAAVNSPTFSARDPNSAALNDTQAIYIGGENASSFNLTSGTTALANATIYTWTVSVC
jgi:hypothetical protein